MSIRNNLDLLAPELKVEVILYLSNPTPLARCSHSWYATVNLPTTKSKWLISKYGKTHALFHAVRMGEPFINVDVVESLLAQKAHISRYFIQRVMLGFGKYDNGLINLKLTHTTRPLDPDRKKIIRRTPWASNLPFNVFSRILKEGYDRFDGNDMPIRGNDMESFYYLSAGPLVISKAREKLKENLNEIKQLITEFKFAPFPPRPGIRNSVNTMSHSVNFDPSPDTDGYENVRRLNVIARAILLHPDLVNVWKRNGCHEIVDDTNDIVIKSVLADCNTNPDQFSQRLKELCSVGFRLTNRMMGDALLSYESRITDIGEALITAFAVVRGMARNDILFTCLSELLNPDRNLKRHDLLDYILDQMDNPEDAAYKVLRSYDIVNPVNVYLGNDPIPQAFTMLKYSPIVYEFMLVKFGADSPVTMYLMGEITTVRIGQAKLHESNSTLASSTASVDRRWQESSCLFNVYCLEGAHIEPQFLPLFKTCPEEFVIQCLFDTYLAKLFDFSVKFQPSRADRKPALGVTPFTHRKRRTKYGLQMKWRYAIRSITRNDDMPSSFKNYVQKFIQREHGKSLTSSKRHRSG